MRVHSQKQDKHATGKARNEDEVLTKAERERGGEGEELLLLA